MKKILLVIVFIFIFALPVSAQNDTYSNAYESIGGGKLEQGLEQNVQDFLNQNGIDAADYNWVNKLTEQNVIEHILKFITSGIKNPLVAGVTIIGVILVTAVFVAFGETSRFETALYAATLAICAIVAADIWQSLSATVNAIKGCSTFMLSFIPVFTAATALSGKTVTAASMSALLLTATETVSFVSSFTILPLMGGYLALSISSGVSPLLDSSGIVEGIKKVSIWILSLVGTLFVGVLPH